MCFVFELYTVEHARRTQSLVVDHFFLWLLNLGGFKELLYQQLCLRFHPSLFADHFLPQPGVLWEELWKQLPEALSLTFGCMIANFIFFYCTLIIYIFFV